MIRTRASGVRRANGGGSGVALGAIALLAFVASGCGGDELWARWRAERAYWHAQRDVDRILVEPRVARPEDYARAERAFRGIVTDFPASRWARPGQDPVERDVAGIAGRAPIALGRLAELQGRTEAALSGYASTESLWRAVPEVAGRAAMRRALALDALDRGPDARQAWEHLVRTYVWSDAGPLLPVEESLTALRRLSDALVEKPVSRDSLLDDAGRRLAALLAATHPARERVAIADALAQVLADRGDLDGSLDAQRLALASSARDDENGRATRIRMIGERSLAAGRVDSALVYARWGQQDFSGAARFDAMDLEARALRRAGKADSALEVYSGMISEFPRLERVAEARFARAHLLETLDRWTLARTEYSALCAAFPSHPRSLEAWERIVRHHRDVGEESMARIEAQHALDALEELLGMQHDPVERARVVEARAAVLLAAGRAEEGIRELQGLWSSVGLSANGARIGMIAADAADRSLNDRALARRLWQILSSRSPDLEVRRRAADALASRPS